jgi:hypothetical protein
MTMEATVVAATTTGRTTLSETDSSGEPGTDALWVDVTGRFRGVRRLLSFCVVLVGCLVPASAALAAPVGFTSAPVAAGGAPLDVAVGDLDGHNGPDLVAAVGEGVAVMLNNGNGTFGVPHFYPTGCQVYQVELADLGGSDNGNVLDGRLDAVVSCLDGGGNSEYLGRLAGDGSGGFGAAHMVPGLNFGPFPAPTPQDFALADVRGPGLPPVPVFTYLTQDVFHEPTFYRVLCVTYDWVNPICFSRETPQTGSPLIAGVVADARVFGTGGTKGIVDWGPFPEWHASTREIAPAPPTTAGNFYSLAIGDLAGDGPDILSAAGSCGCGYQDVAPAGTINVLYGNTAVGVPDQVGTKFPSAPGVTSIATGDFDLDGHEDVIGNSWSYSAPTATSTGAVFVQSGNGAGALGPPQMFPLSHTEGISRAPIRVADFDGNGGPDAVAIVSGQIEVLLNTQSKALAKPLSPLAGIKGLPKKVTVDKHGNLLLGTATNPPTASVDLTVLLPSGKAGKGKGKGKPRMLDLAKPKGKKKKKGTVIGHAKITIPAGKKKQLKVHLKKKALIKLKAGPLKVSLTVVAVATDGTKQTVTRPLTIKPPKAKKHHH